jgi:hypothetical protein
MSKPTKEEQAEILRAKTECITDDPIKWFEMGYFDQYVGLFSKELKISNTRLGEILGCSYTFIYHISSFQRNMSMKQLVKFAKLLQMSDAEKIKLYEKVGGV